QPELPASPLPWNRDVVLDPDRAEHREIPILDDSVQCASGDVLAPPQHPGRTVVRAPRNENGVQRAPLGDCKPEGLGIDDHQAVAAETPKSAAGRSYRVGD